MNKNLQSPTKLTEFAPIQSEEKPQSVGQFITKFFKLNKLDERTPATSPGDAQEALPTWATDPPNEASKVYHVDVNEGRSLPNVLKRISNLLALKSSDSDTDLKQYWMPDSVSKECYECCEKFTTFRRKHHCRVCGQIFCSQCCNQQIPGKIFGCTGDLRVCTYCCKVVLAYLQSPDCADLKADLRSLQENLQSKFGSSSPSPTFQDNSMQSNKDLNVGNSLRRKISVGYQEEKFAGAYLTTEEKCKALQNSASLRALFDEICRVTTGIPLGTHRYRLRTYMDCFLGSELVDWLIYQQKANTRVQASTICQALLEGGYIECVSDPCSFVDGYALYKPGLVVSPEPLTPHDYFDTPQEEPIWVQQIPQESSTTDSDNEQICGIRGKLRSSSSYTLDLNVGANTVYLSKPPASTYSLKSTSSGDNGCHNQEVTVRTSEQREFVPEAGWHNALSLREENGEKMAYDFLTEVFQQHEQSLLKQLLSINSLSLSWTDVIIPLCHEVVNLIRPDKNHDAEDLDVRHYVKFKKLSGGSRGDTKLIRGIVCSKNVAHKGMSVDIENPKILLLQCSIVYQRTEGRLMSLEPVLMQEHEYLRHVAARITALKPDIVLVHRNVSRLAQDLLRLQGITLVHNVKQSVLDQLSRCTEADLVTAVDAHIGRPKLGTCKHFYLKSFEIERGGVKTLMFFEGLPEPHLGGTVLLRGASKLELARLENVASLFLFSVYNWRLEKSFLMDEFVQPPNTSCEFLDDSKENSPTLPNIERKSYENKDNEVKRIEKNDKKTNAETVSDFTDPLQSFPEGHTGPERFTEKLSVAELPFSNNFRKALDDTILCISPYLRFSVPYLETEHGKKCKLRKFFPPEIYFSEQFVNQTKTKVVRDIEEGRTKSDGSAEDTPLHPFLTVKITTTVDNNEIQGLLANFRACGGRYEKKEILYKPFPKSEKLAEKLQNKLDVLEIHNHQRIAVLFCSFSYESNNAPAFCVNPWIVNMNFYGSNDIPLGCFLERYCFRATYNCPSKPCDTPMSKHVRRFVHNAGCVSISLNNFENEFQDDNIVMWTWCTKCQTVSPVVPMSADTWSFSFAKYLELKFYGNVYSRRGNAPCGHSLHHDHYQYFGYKNCVASFKYTSVQIWEIFLPPPVITFQHEVERQQSDMIDEVKSMAQRGHEIYSLIFDKLSSFPAELEGLGNLKQLLLKEQGVFKQKVEEVQLKLTSPTIESKSFEQSDIVAAYWKISDSLVRIKRLIVETVDTWNLRLSETTRKRDDKKKDRSSYTDLESPVSDSKADFTDSDSFDNPTTKKIRSLDQEDESGSSSPKTHQRSQSDGTVMAHEEQSDKKDDKKSVKNILSQLLPSSTAMTSIPNPFNPQDHYTLPPGVFLPILVYENERSSIIAYALNSFDYKKSFEDLVKKIANSEQTPSPVIKRKNLGGERNDVNDDKTLRVLGFLRSRDSKGELNPAPNSNQPEIIQCEAPVQEDSKKTKNLHIEVQFQDSNCNFFCRIYFAEKFANLRALVLPIGEEAFVRSLSRCVQWNARGGKSGSNFAKTVDDRLILKEMSKSEVQLFLESAPNYFAYMQKCYSTGQPTLLGKIVGVYQIIFKNSSNVTVRTNLLVMENLFYKKTVAQKFDLKGSMRNRLVVPDNQEGEIVLLDENLLKMTCDAPLYILPHSKAVLTAAIQNDTEFLSVQSVMDYSLLVGLDSENKELVLGIIDYIRTFTWDKKLETMVKKSGILGGQGKLPTIISPEEYQKRFIEAMHRYFLEVPDHWAGLGKGLEF